MQGARVTLGALLLAAGCVAPAPARAPPKSILWAACGNATSLAAASSWVLISSQQLKLVGTDLCLTYPGKEAPKSWGPHLVARPCDGSDAGQRWALWRWPSGDGSKALRYMGEPNAPPVCIQADAGSPWIDAPAATWPCGTKASWPETIKQLPGSLSLIHI